MDSIQNLAINIKFKLLKKEDWDADRINLDINFNINLYDVDTNAWNFTVERIGKLDQK